MGSCQSASAADKTANTSPEGFRKSEMTGHPSNGAERNDTNRSTSSTLLRRIDDDTDHLSITHSTTSRHENVKKWKEDLSSSGNLTKAIVHIETSLTKGVEDVYDGVHNGPILGSGVAGIVRKCRHRQTGIDYAVKALNIGLIESEAIIEALREEIFIMCQADHPDILRLEEVYESDSQIYLILNLLTGGDMFDRLEEQPDYRYSEVQCANIVKQMMNSVRYLHSKKVIHRDLKLENFLFVDAESDNIQLIDFGLSKHFNDDGCKHCDAVGTPYTIAPEMIKGEYDEKVDVWALGVITYLLLSGDPPFGGMDGEALLTVRQKILECNLAFEPKDVWDGISDTAKNFVKRLLTEDPEKRPSAFEAQHDEWLVKCANMDPEQRKPLNPILVTNLMKFKDYTNLQKILLEVVSFTLIPGQIKDLKQEFEKIDRDGIGEISLENMKQVLLNRVEIDSLGTLTEEEVETIFNSLRLNTKETTIKWHKFITAGLSRCDYDDRNLRLAFNRLDYDSKGFISISDLSGILSSNDGAMDEEIMNMWKDGMKGVECKHKDKIYFADFQSFLKGHAPRQSMMLSLRDSGSLSRYSQSSHESRASGGLKTRMSSARMLTSALTLEIQPEESESTTDDTESNGVATRKIPRRLSRSSSTAFLTTSRKHMHPVPERTVSLNSTKSRKYTNPVPERSISLK